MYDNDNHLTRCQILTTNHMGMDGFTYYTGMCTGICVVSSLVMAQLSTHVVDT